jgi:hypothetical protein
VLPKCGCHLLPQSADEVELVKASSPTVSVDYDMQVVEAVAELSIEAFPDGLRAALLTGSLARSEGTWLQDGSRVRLAGDADLLAVFDDAAVLPPPARVAQLERAIEDRLASAGVVVHISLSPVPVGYLRSLQPNIFSYELITRGKVIYGDRDVLKLAPAFAASEIPLEDGFRLLMNRIVELLETVCGTDEPGTSSPATRYRALKLWLDMATSYLLFERQYSPSYRGRAARLRELAAQPRADASIPLRQFAQAVALATHCKLNESNDLAMREFGDLATLTGYVHSLWRWELERLTATSASDDDMMHQWIAGEPITARLRGWAGVVKRSGAACAVSRMPRWIGLARKGSPRRLTYAAASELLFAFSHLDHDSAPGGASRWNELRRQLPLTDNPENPAAHGAPRRLGRAIAYNYNLFLAPTRS